MKNERQKTILLVEDEALLAIDEKLILEKYGYEVITADSGEKAVKTIETTPDIDLILMDIDLGSGMDGTDAAEIILKDNDIPIVFLSSHTEPEIVEKTEKITSYGYVVKNTGETVLDVSIKMAFKLFYARMEEKRTREQLSKNKKLLDLIYNSTVDLVALLEVKDNSTYHLISCNDGYEKNVKIINPDFKKDLFDEGFELRDFCKFISYPGKETEELVKRYDTVRIDKKEEIKIEKIPIKDGFMYLESSTNPILDLNGDCRYILYTSHNITELKLAEEALKEERDFLEILINSAKNSHIVSLDRDFNFIRVNEAYATTCGYRPEEMIGKNHFVLYPNPDIEAIFARVIDTGDPFEIHDNPFEFPDQPERGITYWDWTLIPTKDSSGYITGLVFSLYETTDKKRAEANLKRLATVVIDSNDAITIQDFEGNIIAWNKGAEIMYGYSEAEALTMNIRDIVPENKQQEALDFIIKAEEEEEEEIPSFETQRKTKDGRILDIWLTVTKLVDDNEKPVGVSTTERDITKKNRTEEALKKTLQQNKDLLRELQHRAKNSFAMISSMIHLTAESSSSDDTKSSLSEVGSRIKAVSEMYDLLYVTDSIKEVQLEEYLTRVVSSMPIVSSNITLKKDCDAIIIPVKIAISIGIIVAELITNSIKHAFPKNRKGIISLSLKNSGAKAFIEINDNGKGLPEGFDMSALDSMGLTLVNALVEQIDGSFKITEDNGTSCILEFPIN